MINILSEETIDKIAAGEVVERPASVVKELCENAIDAGASMISVEIRGGGIELIRVTDNGCGIGSDELKKAFMRHATSKITCIDDLLSLDSLGFRGEALSSIAAVARVEVITKTEDKITASRYTIEGAKAGEIQEVGAPGGTTFLIRDLFFNTPVRRKFLKSAATEGAYVAEVMEHLALSHPEISFSFLNGSRTVVQTGGRGELKDIIYSLYGRDIARELVTIDAPSVTGYIARPVVARSNRNHELFFVNGRFVKSTLLSKAVEEAYRPYLMQHRFPFCVLHINLAGAEVDANVHPTKLEVRFSDNERIYNYIRDVAAQALKERELIPSVPVPDPQSALDVKPVPDVQSVPRLQPAPELDNEHEPEPADLPEEYEKTAVRERAPLPFEKTRILAERAEYEAKLKEDEELNRILDPVQMNLFEEKILTKEKRQEYRILGQAFDTYWIIEYRDKLMFIDQHAAHEKVLYERFIKEIDSASVCSQNLLPPVIVSLSSREVDILEKYMSYFSEMGFEIENFGGKEYALRAVPENLSSLNTSELFVQMLDDLCDNDGRTSRPDMVRERIATMACKAAVKGNNRLSVAEAETLIDELLELDNPYNCPHGRPTMITMSKYEMEKKFKRIV